MKVRKWWLAGTIVAVLGLAGPGQAQQTPSTEPDFPRGRISGYLFGDVYYNVVGDPKHTYNASGADAARPNIDGSTSANGTPNVIGRDLNGMQIRRIYFQADNDLSIKYSTRFRLEADSKAFTSDGKIGVFVKAAYLQAKNVYPSGNFFIGMLPTPIFETAEDLWGYRSLEKTIADFRGLASSADLGAEVKGSIDAAKKVQYSAMVGDGTGQKPENNRYKRAYFALPTRPNDMFLFEPYIDYESAPNNEEHVTYKGLLGIDHRRATLGLEVVDRINHLPGGTTTEPFGISAYARGKMKSQLGWVLRYDRWQPNTRLANRIDSDLYIAGLDWEPFKDVHLLPNVEATQYRARGTAVAPPHHDLQARITVYYRWSKP
jgi:hypothetical protein